MWWNFLSPTGDLLHLIDSERIFPAVFSQSCACPTPFALENPRINAIPQEIRWKRERAGTDGLLRGGMDGMQRSAQSPPGLQANPEHPSLLHSPQGYSNQELLPQLSFP